MPRQVLVLWFLLIGSLAAQAILIPLAYAYLPDLVTKIPIEISFVDSSTYAPKASGMLYLYNANISLQVRRRSSQITHGGSLVSGNLRGRDVVVIGLKYPSEFIMAIAATYSLKYDSVEFGKNQYLELILNEEDYVQSRDVFINDAAYDIRADYNFGQDIVVQGKTCRLIDSDEVYFDELLIREILSKMQTSNKITFAFNVTSETIILKGQLENFPKITLMLGNSLFQLSIKTNVLHYLPTVNDSQTTLVGYRSLHDFSKFKFDDDHVVFRQTSEIFMLYLFLGYFFVFGVFLITHSKQDIFDSSVFIRNVLKWTLFEDQTARVAVLRTELE